MFVIVGASCHPKCLTRYKDTESRVLCVHLMRVTMFVIVGASCHPKCLTRYKDTESRVLCVHLMRVIMFVIVGASCHPKCVTRYKDTRYCWGEGPDMCQKRKHTGWVAIHKNSLPEIRPEKIKPYSKNCNMAVEKPLFQKKF